MGQLFNVGQCAVPKAAHVPHVDGLQLPRLVSADVVPGDLRVHVRPEGDAPQNQRADHRPLHVGESGLEQPHGHEDCRDPQPEHENFRQHPFSRQAVAANVKQHFRAGRGDEEQRRQPEEQAQPSGQRRGTGLLFHQSHGKAHQPQIDKAQPRHLEKSPAGVFRQRVSIGQNSREAAAQIRQLAQQIHGVDQAHRSQQNVHGNGAETVEALRFFPVFLRVFQSHAPGIQYPPGKHAEEQGEQRLRPVGIGEHIHQPLKRRVGTHQQENQHRRHRQGDQYAEDRRAAPFARRTGVFPGVVQPPDGGAHAAHAQRKYRPGSVQRRRDAAGFPAALPGHPAEAEIHGKQRHQQHPRLHVAVRRPGKPGENRRCQNQQRRLILPRPEAAAKQIPKTAPRQSHRPQGKSQTKTAVKNAVPRKRAEKQHQKAKNQFPFSRRIPGHRPFFHKYLLSQRFHGSSSCTNSNRSPGWHCSSRQMASMVLMRTALALPVFRMDRLAGVMPTRFASSREVIFRFASIISRFTIIAIRRLTPSDRFLPGSPPRRP